MKQQHHCRVKIALAEHDTI